MDSDEAGLRLIDAVATHLAVFLTESDGHGWSPVYDGEPILAGDRRVFLAGAVGAALDSISSQNDILRLALTHYGAAVAIESDLNRLSQDLVSGAETIATTAARAAAPGVDDPALIYLIAAGRRVHHQLLDRALEEAEAARQGLAELPLLSDLANESLNRLHSLRDKLGTDPPEPLHPIPEETPPQNLRRRARSAAKRARGFLLADPLLLEAREVQRREGLDRGEMTSLFPVSFPLETLARHGEAVQDRLEIWMTDLGDRSFAYYDHRLFQALDSDTVGAVLRLSVHLPDQEAAQNLVARLQKAVGGGDRIPVWLERPAGPGLRLTGEGCAAVEANLLLGLAQARRDHFDEFGSKAFARLGKDFVARGCAIATDYVSEYLLVPLARLLAVRGVDDPEILARMRFEIEKRATTASAQTAAFLSIAATALPGLGFDTSPWADLIVRAQRHDGGVDAEPLFWVNGPGGRPEWFKSRTVTTSFCFDALSSDPLLV